MIGIEFAVKSGYPYSMTRKQKLLAAVKSLPANASYEDAVERLVFLAKIEKGIKQADAGETISHRKVKQKMGKWLK
jgi:predicted transcriptional regulator